MDNCTFVVNYLIDSHNPTGYAQVLEEKDVSLAVTKSYTIGDDIISQTTGAGTEYLLYDGHGSTRQLAESNGDVVENYSYDGYGVMLGDSANAADSAGTSMLYAGEQFDTDAQQYYLRARYYDPLNGRFNRMDPFSGNTQDPQSLHKYLYAHCNPVNGIDPTGQFTIVQTLVAIAIIGAILGVVLGPLMYAEHRSWGIQSGAPPRRIAIIYRLDFTERFVWGISGVGPNGLARQLRAAGHTVTLSVAPDENEFFTLLNNNEIVLVIAHGASTLIRGDTGHYDQNGKPFAAMKLGGQTQSQGEIARGALTGIEEAVPAMWITANELDEKIDNPNLEFVAAACELGKTNRMYKAINPATFIASKEVLAGMGIRNAMEYVVDRANGIDQGTAFSNLLQKNSGFVLNPSNPGF